MRITGMASGMDIDSIVKDLMKAERMPLDKIKQKKSLVEFKMDMYREMNTKLITLRDKVNSLRYSASFSQTKTTSGNEAIVSATVAPGTAAASHNVIVEKLAKGASRTSGGSISSASAPTIAGNDSLDATTTINGADRNNQFFVTLNGVKRSITLDNGDYTPAQLQQQLQTKLNQTFGANKVSVDLDASDQLSFTALGSPGHEPSLSVDEGNGALVGKLKMADKSATKINPDMTLDQLNAQGLLGNAFVPDATDGTKNEIKINGISIQYSSSDSLRTIMGRINNSAAGVTASYDSVSDKLMMTTKLTGQSQKIEVEDVKGNLAAALKIDNASMTSATYSEGQDAKVTIDSVTSYRDSNSFTLDGVTYNLKKESTESVAINVTQDTDAIFNSIKEFVNAYNETVGYLNGKISERKAYGYNPLTAEQREDMSDTDEANWDKLVKQGLLHYDPTLRSASTELRKMLSSLVPGVSEAFNSLSKIGLSSVKYTKSGYTVETSGMIELDENKLKEALSQDPDSVMQTFTRFASAKDSTQNGIFHQMYDKLNTTITGLVTKAGRTSGSYVDVTTELGLQDSKLATQISQWESRLTSKENLYYKQFSAMEKALANSNSQMQALMQFSG